MKKIFSIKLLLIFIISLSINFFITEKSFANGETKKTGTALKFATVFDEMEPCISEAEAKGGYIITYIEEPLNVEDDNGKSTGDFIRRACYRNTFSYTNDEGKRNIISKERTTCSDEAVELAKSNPAKNAQYSCKEIQALLSKGGTALIYGYISTIYQWGASMVGIIAVLVIVISGIQLSVAGGDSGTVDEAKKRILTSLAAIAVLFLSGLILYTINPTFFVK